MSNPPTPWGRRVRGQGRWFIVAFILVMLSLTGWTWWTHPPRSQMARLKPNFVVDVNEADLLTLASLPGLGRTTAQRIIDDRERQGRFTSPQQLTRVKGIGPGRLAKLQPWIVCGQATPSPATAPSSILQPMQKTTAPEGAVGHEADESRQVR